MKKFIAIGDTDVGLVKKVNQDSLLIKHATSDLGDIVLAIICDGMGGLSKGELASAEVIREFSRWFDQGLPTELDHLDMNLLGYKFASMLKGLNEKISAFASSRKVTMGTTFTGILFIDHTYVVCHIGDSRLYYLNNNGIRQLTTDHSFVAREIRRGTMTEEEARHDRRRNMLLQCVGASQTIDPEIFCGEAENGIYMLCSDGFRHEISDMEIFDCLHPNRMKNEKEILNAEKKLIELNKSRRETDNISVIAIRVSE